jgi:hypothetical protein
MAEVVQATDWIVARCKADTALMAVATGGVWRGLAPLGTTMPYVLVVHQVMTDTNTIDARRLMARGLFQIKMVGLSTQYDNLETGADRIDELFKSQSSVALSPVGGILESYRSQSLTYEALVNGLQESHLGGLYNIDVQAT